MGKIRVFEAAKQHECDVHELLDELQKLDVKVRSHLSPVSEEDIAKAVAKMGKAAKKAKAVDAAPSDDAAKLKPVLRRRKKASVEGAFEEAEAAVEEEVVAVKAIDETPAAEAEAGGAAEIETEAKPAAEVEEPAAVEAEAEQPVAGAEQEAQPEEKAEVKEEEKAEVPAEKAEKAEEEDSQKDEFKLKVVRFIHTPIDDKTSAPAFTYHMSKEERQAKKASKKGKIPGAPKNTNHCSKGQQKKNSGQRGYNSFRPVPANGGKRNRADQKTSGLGSFCHNQSDDRH